MKQTAVFLFIVLNIGAILANPVVEDGDKGGVKECLLKVIKDLTNCLVGGTNLTHESQEGYNYDESSESYEYDSIENEEPVGDAKQCFKNALKCFFKCFTGFEEHGLSVDEIMPFPMIYPFDNKNIHKVKMFVV